MEFLRMKNFVCQFHTDELRRRQSQEIVGLFSAEIPQIIAVLVIPTGPTLAEMQWSA
jgi:hypothetical protein